MRKYTEEIIEHIANTHHRDDIYDEEESDLAARVNQYSYFQLEEVLVDEIDIDWNVDEDLVEKYSEFTTEPPIIVLESNQKTIIDGTHRVVVCKNKKIKTIKAYVGKI